MLEAGVECWNEREAIVEAFMALPEELRPLHFSHHEKLDSINNRTDDRKRLMRFLAKSSSGFFLLGPRVTYSIRSAVSKSTVCDCFLEVAPHSVKELLIGMAALHPVFGFACTKEEREHRNRIATRRGENIIESWVGRDSERYVPGLYWLTLLSEDLATKHGVPLSRVIGAALEHVELEGGQHLLRFYDAPENWKSASGVTELITALPGIFNVERVKPQLQAAETFVDVSSVVGSWR
jgi:hypothetical protein